MPVFQKIISFDDTIRRLKTMPIIINDIVDVNENGDIVDVKNLIYSNFSSDIVSAVPSCECGKTTGEFSIGLKCEECHTEVRSRVYDDIKPLVWFRRPEGVAKIINPMVWIMLTDRFTKSGFNVLLWICDVHYVPPKKQPAVLQLLVNSNIQRGYNWFVENFDHVIEMLFSLKEFRKQPQIKKRRKGDSEKNIEQIDPLKRLILENRDKIFSDFIPLPNKTLLIVESTNVGVYVDNTVADAIDAIEMLTSIDSPIKGYSVRQKENRTAKAINKLSIYYDNFYKNILDKKSGMFRKHVYASRTHFSFRAVITSITDKHDHDEVYIPWKVAIATFKFHLINKLMKRGYEYNQAIGYLYSKLNMFDPLLDELFKELINESPYGGIPATLNRNPSLLIGSIQFVRITKVKTDPEDQTISLSILIVKAPNADFDGDEMQMMLALDDVMYKYLEPLKPHNNVFTLGEHPGKVSGNPAIPKPVVATIANWLHNDTNQSDIVPQEMIDLLGVVSC